MIDRTLTRTTTPFVRNGDVPLQDVHALEGQPEGMPGGLRIKPLLVGGSMLFMEARRKKGLVDPEHVHPDHDSICYLVSGRMRVVIDGREWIAEPGDVWMQEAGVPHFHETLEDSVQVEIKSPPRKTWT